VLFSVPEVGDLVSEEYCSGDRARGVEAILIWKIGNADVGGRKGLTTYRHCFQTVHDINRMMKKA
jgi:hypothetical protein